MDHDEFMVRVLGLCDDYGVLAYHTRDSRRDEPGYPDLTLVGRHGILWRELKTGRGKLRSAQTRWLYAIRAAGGDAGVWRPAELRLGVVATQLNAIGPRRASPTNPVTPVTGGLRWGV